MTELLIAAAAGVLAGALLSWFIRGYQLKAAYRMEPGEVRVLRDEFERSSREIGTLEERISQTLRRFDAVQTERDHLAETNARLEKDQAGLKVSHKQLEARLEEQKHELVKQQEQLREQFKNLASDILEEKSKRFTEMNQKELDRLLKPLGENIESFRKKVEDTYDKESKDRVSLREQIFNLAELNKRMSEEANNLTKALKGDSKTQGNWGEVVLERILERSGLQKGREFETQFSAKTEEGDLLRPDVVVRLPDDKYLVIDAKVSLTAWERIVSAEDQASQEQHLREHLTSVRAHVKSLSDKDYSRLFEKTPDFVLMFIPIEPAFGMAMMHDTGLYNEAFEKNIVMVSPSTLLATMATIRNIWKYEYQNQNALHIAKEGGKLYDKFVGFSEDLEKVGEQLKRTSETYDKAMNKLTTGKGNLISKAEKMRELGVPNRKNLPPGILQPESDDDEENDV